MKNIEYVELENENKVKIIRDSNTEIIEGFIADGKCPKCGNKKIYNEEYDAYFCAEYNEWLEGTCNDPECIFCPNRTPKPLSPYK